MHRLHPQTLRAWERQGLLNPSRSGGNTRLYTEQDLDTLSVILNLTRDLGVNLAGVEVILNMRHKMETMQKEVEEMIDFLRSQLGAELWDGRMEGLVKKPPSAPVRGPSLNAFHVPRFGILKVGGAQGRDRRA